MYMYYLTNDIAGFVIIILFLINSSVDASIVRWLKFFDHTHEVVVLCELFSNKGVLRKCLTFVNDPDLLSKTKFKAVHTVIYDVCRWYGYIDIPDLQGFE